MDPGRVPSERAGLADDLALELDAEERKRRQRARDRRLGCVPCHVAVTRRFIALRDSARFQAAVLLAVLLAGVLVGVNSYPQRSPAVARATAALDEVVIGVFLAELAVKVLAEGTHPWRYFADALNVLDFLIIIVAFLPIDGSALTALRLVRLLRVVKLIHVLPRLRILVIGLLNSLSSIVYIGMLLFLVFYIYAIVGLSLFQDNDPVHFGSLHLALITLFRVSTVEDSSDVQYINMYGCDQYGYAGMEQLCTAPAGQPLVAVVYFISFMLISTMTILNLFIGVIMQQLHAAEATLKEQQREHERELEELEERARLPKPAPTVHDGDGEQGEEKEVGTGQRVIEIARGRGYVRIRRRDRLASMLERLDALEDVLSELAKEFQQLSQAKESELKEKRRVLNAAAAQARRRAQQQRRRASAAMGGMEREQLLREARGLMGVVVGPEGFA